MTKNVMAVRRDRTNMGHEENEGVVNLNKVRNIPSRGGFVCLREEDIDNPFHSRILSFPQKLPPEFHQRL